MHLAKRSLVLLMLGVAFGSAAPLRAQLPLISAPPPIVPYSLTSWPLTIQSPNGLITIYQPQPDSLEGDMLKARSAVSLQPPGATEPLFGAVWLRARVWTDRDARTVTITNVEVHRTRFADVSDDQQAQFSQALQQQMPRMNITFALDQLMTSLAVAEKEKAAAADLEVTPPKILFSTTPATLVVLDGAPRLQPLPDGPGLMRVVNTPFIVLFDSPSRHYFLKAGVFWYSAGDIGGPWTNVGAIPAGVLAAGTRLSAPPPGSVAPPAPDPQSQPNPGWIIVSQEPAELICTDGAPAYTPLPGNDLLYVANTRSDVFLEVATQRTFVLLSGRWFVAASTQGPWTFVPADKLPPAFAQIPPDSAKANVLVSVAGTTAAREARLDAQIPQTAAVDRNAGQTLNVSYDGEPRFESVQQSPVSYAVNCADPVLLVQGRYYCCHQAVWYESPVAVGPWAVCVSVPAPIYTLPPSCPVYYVRYCYVYDATPEYVYCGYLPGYTGCYVYGPTVVWGTGYYYHGWYEHEYYPRPCTWGFSAHFDISVSAWGCGADSRYDRGWFVASGDHHGWWGPRGFIDYHSLPRSREWDHGDRGGDHGGNTYVNKTVINNTYNTYNSTTINRLNIYNRTDNIRRKVVINRNTYIHNDVNVQERGDRRPEREPAISRPEPRVDNNVYAGHDGTVYRRTNDGWQQRVNKGWQNSPAVPEARGQEPTAREREIEHSQSAPPTERGPERSREPAHVEPTHEPIRGEPTHEPERVNPSREPSRVEPSRAEPSREPVRLEPSHAPERVAPSHEPARTESPREPARATEEQPRSRQQPTRSEPSHAGGLETDHVARQRGNDRTQSYNPGPMPDRSAPDRSAPDRSAPDRSAPDHGGNSGRQSGNDRNNRNR